jgi:hypothetical protein
MKPPRRRPIVHSPELREILAPRPSLRGRILSYAVVAAVILVAVLLVLVGAGILRLPNSGGSSTAPVTVAFVHWTLLEGTGNNSTPGWGWFGPYQINYTGPEGYPLEVAPGSEFIVPLVVTLLGPTGHEVYSAFAQAPFELVSTNPPLPIFVNPTDDAAFMFTVRAPPEPGAVLGLNMTFNALPP